MFQFYSCTIYLFRFYSMLVTFSTLTPPSLRSPHPRLNISTRSTSFKPPIFMLPHPLSASFSFVGGEGRRTINCGEAATQSVECKETKEVRNPMGIESDKGKEGETRTERYQWGQTLAHTQKQWKAYNSIWQRQKASKLGDIGCISHPLTLCSLRVLPS